MTRRSLLAKLVSVFVSFASGRPALARRSMSDHLEKPGVSAPRLAARPREPWDERFEFVIAFTFGDAQGGMASRRPYVVVYVEDPQARLVRTISLWAQPHPPWVRWLRRWFPAHEKRSGGVHLMSTITGATRPAGRYTVVWDGRDEDHRLVEQGEYFLCLETVRQNSQSYFIRHPFTFASTPFTAQLEDYAAFGEIRLEFRHKR